MTYAIIETGGKQLRVEPGRFYDVERLHVEPDANVSIDKVLFVQGDGGVHIGQPLVEGATVEATVMSHFRGRKIIVYKMRPKKKTRKKQGHRQELTRMMVNSINLDGNVLASSQSEATDTSQTEVSGTEVEVAAEPIAVEVVEETPEAAE